jgi:hypothetical protein
VEDFIAVKQQFTLQLAEGDVPLQALCGELNIPLFSQNGALNVSVQDDAQLNFLIDKLREKQLTIRGIIPRKISLEDFFIDVVEEKEGPKQ